MLRALPPALLATTLLWVYFFAQPRGFLEYVLIPVALPFLAIAIKRWIQSWRNPYPPLPKLAGEGPSRDPMRYLNAAATVVRIMLLFVLFGMFVGMHGTIIDYANSIELVRANSAIKKPNAAREDAIVVAVGRDEKIYLGNEQIAPQYISLAVLNAVGSGAEKRVYIKADRHVRYRAVKSVLEEVSASGIENVTFLAEAAPGPQPHFFNILRQ
jgi:biopolymer transport protein ExbD/biopolymer transport protein TolR